MRTCCALPRAASRIVGELDVVVLGSQAILGSYSELDLPAEAIGSIEADLAFLDDPVNDKADRVDGAIGEDSQFHQMNGYYGQGVNVAVAVLPAAWRDRVVIYGDRETEPGRGLCLEPHDLVVAKLAAGREKDFTFAAALLAARIVDADLLRERAELLDTVPLVRRRVREWIDVTAQRLGGQD